MHGVRFSFGDFVVDTERYLIERDDLPVDVQPQVFNVLAYLLEHRDRVVPKEELLDKIWGDRFVSESALTSRIKSARQLVGDDGVTQACIKTAHGRGYRWVADVHVAPSASGSETEAAAGGSALIAPPVPLTSLVGRESEIATVVASIDDRRLTTAVGPPGVGKSRLVTEVARALAQAGREVAFVDLRLANEGHDVAQLVQRATGVAWSATPHELRPIGADDSDLFDQLVEQLGTRALLLVLDNCEHVAATVGELSFDLLTRCPELGIVATSQRRLGVVGEAAVLVEPLAVPDNSTTSWGALIATDAGRLFVERSVAAGSRWTASAVEVRLAADVCRRLDGLPLAIELAAAKTPWLALPDLVRHLDRELGQAGGNPLDAALRMSRALLSGAEARAFDALSVFAGSFTIDAALAVIEVVCPEHDALSVFARLVDHSLISVSDGAPRRYRLLETIQRYADMCRLSSAAPDVPVRAHARFYLDFIERRWPAGRIVTDTSWELLGAEMTEVLAAIERTGADDPGLARQLVGAVGWYWSFGGYAEQCEEFGARLSGVGGDDTPAIEAAFLWACSDARHLLGRDAVELAKRAHALAVEAGSWSVAAWSLAHVIVPDMNWADLAVVEPRWADIVDLFRRADDPLGEAFAMVWVLGFAEACAQLHARATHTYEEAAALLERNGDAMGAGRALLEVIELDIWSNDLEGARSAFERVPASDDAPLEYRVRRLWLGGQLAGAVGDWDTAIDWQELAVELCEQSVPGSILANTHRCLLGWTMRWSGRADEAAARFERALTFLPKTSATRQWAGHSTWVVESVAGLLAEVGAVEPAARLMAAAHRERRELDAPMPYWDRARYEPDLQRIREQLDDAKFDAAWSNGLELELPTAFQLAQDELSRLIGRAST
jgi:predicted ATPase/DNA-binding winged helix-turn-helix (wHTH) protein/tetratricopeptide (TPR) repeat protein